MINVHGIRRNMKNVVRNYTDAQIKVREATSNDPWGPSSTLMSEIADLTYNVVAFSEIMQMIWKRLNDHGRNWRHVYKALVLLEYLIKTGSEKVAQQCKENIFAIQTLKDFQYTEDNKDQGMNVREKSKQLVSLLKDDERLKNERTRALKAKERFAQATAHVGSETLGKQHSVSSFQDPYTSPNGATSPRELECARPQTVGEEELQLQLALAMSKEEAEQEERMRRSDDLRLQIALTESKEDFRRTLERVNSQDTGDSDTTPQKSALDDLLGISLPNRQNGAASGQQMTDPWGVPINEQPQVTDPWGSPLTEQAPHNDAWGTASAVTSPAAETPSSNLPATISSNANLRPGIQKDGWRDREGSPIDTLDNDPWSPKPAKSASSNMDAFGVPKSMSATNGEFDDFDVLSRRSNVTTPDSIGPRGTSPNPFDMENMKDSLQDQPKTRARKTPESFLGPNSNLVNLEALVSTKASPPVLANTIPIGGGNNSPVHANAAVAPGATNPFAAPSPLNNPFQAAKPPPPTINQLRAQNQFTAFSPQNTSTAVPATAPLTGSGLEQQAFGPAVAPAAAGYPTASSPQLHNPFL